MRVVSVTPAGRRRYMELLVTHLLRQRPLIAEHHWWLNTDVPADIAFVHETCRQHPDFFRVCEKPFDASKPHGDNIWKFFRDFAQPDTVYVRFDDDIVWMAPDAVERIVQARIDDRESLLVLGNIVNNSICTAAHQRAGLIPSVTQTVNSECSDEVGWKNPITARKVHQAFLSDLTLGQQQRWTEVEIPLGLGQRFSINVISWLGETMAQIPELPDDEIDEEPFLTQELPQRLNRPNTVCSEALFAHFAFWPQRPYLDWTSSDLLEQYRAAAQLQPIPTISNLGYMGRDLTWRLSKPARKLHRSLAKRMA
ncbi:hypothetical protein NG895_06645 [Aeoliella sp. ICT_H6.2]|uniref:Uncharacterized protein n=1 Tax=Aeoliella straminimaris TaxID=2954799 RepID=A0A9X2F783_9BACT|nr:hypothetical protein [Aeoliella straminimaris]MCO6043580.1 hypothetical protein [Aeoliella straminimaris]